MRNKRSAMKKYARCEVLCEVESGRTGLDEYLVTIEAVEPQRPGGKSVRVGGFMPSILLVLEGDRPPCQGWLLATFIQSVKGLTFVILPQPLGFGPSSSDIQIAVPVGSVRPRRERVTA